MKSRFSTFDIAVATTELEGYIGLRVVNVYDIDNKTYLIKLQKPDSKAVILIESGIRIQSTEFDWPKNPAPSGFSMKLRKHLKNRRLESIVQLGVDRIVDLTFGSGEAAYHLIVELYDRGNIVLTDVEYNILNILRSRTDDNHDVRFAVREKYPINVAKEHSVISEQRLQVLVSSAKENDVLKKILIPHLDYGPAVIEHCLREVGFPENVKIGKGFNIAEDFSKLKRAVENAELLFINLTSLSSKGYIIQKREKRPNPKEGESKELLTYDEFHPYLFKQNEGKSYLEFETFNKAVDEFFSQQESQKLDMKILHQEKTALKKLDNIKKDHVKRLTELQKEQELDKVKAELIELNLPMVEQALLIVRSAVANQIDWTEIWNIVQEAQAQGDPVACAIKGLKLDTNQFTMFLKDPYVTSDDEDDGRVTKPLKIDIDLSLSAYANSRKYFEQKRHAGKKEQKTVDSSAKALKSAERKTKELLKDVQTAATINKVRKIYWFEKFLWFITSENFLVIGGRDSQQNELLVKRYFRPGDLYVHADLHGASSVIIKNPTGEPVPPKSLNEAGTMALCCSAAWDAKVVTSAWWVHHEQVSKTAPTGEYLTTGSFMIRGKKNYLPPSHLIYGFGILFKLEEGSVFRHEGERRVRGLEEDDDMSVISSIATESELGTEGTNSVESSDSEDSDSDDDNTTDSNSIVLTPIDEGGINASGDVESDCEDFLEQDIENTSEKVDNNSKEPEESVFPDTDLKLQHVKGDKYKFERSASHPEETSENGPTLTENKEEKNLGKAKLSAKQRRELRKSKKGIQSLNPKETDEEDKVSWLHLREESSQSEQVEQVDRKTQDGLNTEQNKIKRGQKSKMRKMREKYADQDDEERRLKMEILCASGAQSEAKKKRARKAMAQIHSKMTNKNQQKGRRPENVMEQYSHISYDESENITELKDLVIKDNPEIEEDEKEQESHQGSDDLQILTSLTGCPLDEDEILYAVPVCAPYSTLLNYKYKVKMLPGSTKKGKATKNSLNNFLHDRAITSREKDLLRILKDVDISRNIPGKVKIATPIVRKSKK